MDIEQAINISKGCVMASYMDSETKQTVIEALNSVAISKTETTSCEWCELEPSEKIFAYGMGFRKMPLNYCPNCGRRLEETP